MSHEYNLQRFIEAQQKDYATALKEIKNGKKQSHWMWYIFPQIQGLGFSSTSKYYAIKDIDEAAAYLQHDNLGTRLIEICTALLALKTNDANKVFGSPDDLKLRSCITLFGALPGSNPVFQSVSDKFFNGLKDNKTVQIITSTSQTFFKK